MKIFTCSKCGNTWTEKDSIAKSTCCKCLTENLKIDNNEKIVYLAE